MKAQTQRPVWFKPMLLLLAVVVCLLMLRLGIWQLDRADQKQQILDQQQALLQQAPVALSELINSSDTPILDRFTPVTITGEYLATPLYVDNRVLDSQVGYQVFMPFKLSNLDQWVMVDRGWLPAGADRAVLPEFETPSGTLFLSGRLNRAPEKPPLWSDDYAVNQGAVWAYLPLEQVEAQLQIPLLAMVVELAPNSDASDEPIRRWAKIDDQWVAKHHGYAFQWFAMAAAFLIAVVVLVIRSN